MILTTEQDEIECVSIEIGLSQMKQTEQLSRLRSLEQNAPSALQSFLSLSHSQLQSQRVVTQLGFDVADGGTTISYTREVIEKKASSSPSVALNQDRDGHIAGDGYGYGYGSIVAVSTEDDSRALRAVLIASLPDLADSTAAPGSSQLAGCLVTVAAKYIDSTAREAALQDRLEGVIPAYITLLCLFI